MPIIFAWISFIMASRRDITGMMARCRGIIPKWPHFSAILYVMFQVDELLQFGQIIYINHITSYQSYHIYTRRLHLYAQKYSKQSFIHFYGINSILFYHLYIH